MSKRVVITGMGVVAPAAPDLASFEQLLRSGRSGVTFRPENAKLDFACQVGGKPEVSEERLERITTPAMRRTMTPILDLSALAASECWKDAGFELPVDESALRDTGLVFGTGIGGDDTLCEIVAPLTVSGRARQLGNRRVQQTMASGPAAFVAGLLGIGGPCISLNSACSTGTSCLVQALRLLRLGECERVLSGSVESYNVYTAAMFDAMRVLARGANEGPASASRPLSAAAAGFVPSGGAGALMLETMEGAQRRGARIYAELAGGFENCGGQRSGGTMTRQSHEGVVRCIQGALDNARIKPAEIDYINGHLTSTSGDPDEIRNLEAALDRQGPNFPWINSTKSLIGHTIGAAGSIESIATVLQLDRGFLHPSINCDPIHSGIVGISVRIPRQTMPMQVHTVLKNSFGFGDVNACVVFRKLS